MLSLDVQLDVDNDAEVMVWLPCETKTVRLNFLAGNSTFTSYVTPMELNRADTFHAYRLVPKSSITILVSDGTTAKPKKCGHWQVAFKVLKTIAL